MLAVSMHGRPNSATLVEFKEISYRNTEGPVSTFVTYDGCEQEPLPLASPIRVDILNRLIVSVCVLMKIKARLH